MQQTLLIAIWWTRKRAPVCICRRS